VGAGEANGGRKPPASCPSPPAPNTREATGPNPVPTCTSKRTWERAIKCIGQLAFKFVVCSVMYSIQCTKSHAYHGNLVTA
jgi:hypothetical protein